MSIARFSETSDVYVFENTSGQWECCGCQLWTATGERVGFALYPVGRPDLMAWHLRAHRAQGHKVRSDTLDRMFEPAG